MTTGNIIGMTASTFFGLWFLIAPRSVLRFYVWFHNKRDFKSINLMLARFGGLLWTILMLYVIWEVVHRPARLPISN